MSTRLSVNINDETSVNLRRLAAELDTNVTEVIRRATAVFTHIHDTGARIIESCVNYRAPNDCRKLLPNTDDWCGICRAGDAS